MTTLVQTRYWTGQQPGSREHSDILNLTGQCADLFSRISREQHGNISVGQVEKLKSAFQTWMNQESLERNSDDETPNAASLDMLLQNGGMSEFYDMTAQELSLLHTQLSRLESCKDRQLKRKRQQGQNLAGPRSKKGRSNQAAKSDPGISRGYANVIKEKNGFLDAGVWTNYSEYASTSSLKSGYSGQSGHSAPSGFSFENECERVDRTFKRLQHVTVLSRYVAVETKHPEINKYLTGGKRDKYLRQIFPRARSWLTDRFPGASQNLQERAAVLMSTTVWDLVLAKDHLKADHVPSYPNANLLLQRSHTLDAARPKIDSRNLSGPLRRVSTAPPGASEGWSGSYYPDLAMNGRGVTKEQVDSTGPHPAARPTWKHQAQKDTEGTFLMCTAASCEDKPSFFQNLEAWERHHHDRHPVFPTWTCTAIAHEHDLVLPEFRSVTNFNKHMRSEHPGSFAESHLPALADACRDPWCCPFCSTTLQSNKIEDEGWDRRKLKHVRQHLEQINAACLVWVPDYENAVTEADTVMEKWENSNVNNAGSSINNSWMDVHASIMTDNEKGPLTS